MLEAARVLHLVGLELILGWRLKIRKGSQAEALASDCAEGTEVVQTELIIATNTGGKELWPPL